jgi:hypothetical protein
MNIGDKWASIGTVKAIPKEGLGPNAVQGIIVSTPTPDLGLGSLSGLGSWSWILLIIGGGILLFFLFRYNNRLRT